MSLPVIPLPRETVHLGDEFVEVRGLTRAEAATVQALKDDTDAMEIRVLALGTGVDEAEVRIWRDATPAGAVEAVVNAIVRLSGIGPEASKSNGSGLRPGGGGPVPVHSGAESGDDSG